LARSQVPTRFQSAEQYLEIFRGLILEEIFATLVAALGAAVGVGGGVGGGGGGGRSTESATMRAAAFVEAGKDGFCHVTLVAGDGGRQGAFSSGGGPAEGGAAAGGMAMPR